MRLVHMEGARVLHAASETGPPLCGAVIRRGDRWLELEDAGGAPTCSRCRSILRDRKRRRESIEGGGGFDPFVQIKLSRNARGSAQWEITVPFGATRAEVDEAHGLAIEEYRRLERELGAAIQAA